MHGHRPYYGYGRFYVDFMRVDGWAKVGADVVAVAAYAYACSLEGAEKMFLENERLRVGGAVHGVRAALHA